MAKLTSAQRNRLPSSDFAEPRKRKYPIENKSHAKNALARVADHGTPEEEAKVRGKVRRKYPSIGKKRVSAKTNRKSGKPSSVRVTFARKRS